MAKDLHKIWGHRWLTPKARPGKSKAHGWGTIAIKDIKKGEIIRVTGGIVLQRKDLKKYKKLIGGNFEININDDFFLAPSRIEEVTKETGIFNHGCDGNIGLADPITVVALRDIKAGEELLGDYEYLGVSVGSFNCRCGAKNCRKFIHPDQMSIADRKKKYVDISHFPY